MISFESSMTLWASVVDIFATKVYFPFKTSCASVFEKTTSSTGTLFTENANLSDASRMFFRMDSFVEKTLSENTVLDFKSGREYDSKCRVIPSGLVTSNSKTGVPWYLAVYWYMKSLGK